jgi:FkbM family methyltransferase
MVLEQRQEQGKEFSLCLNMIVKNESHIIKDKLTKLLQKIKFDYWVISDTGSTDKTIEIITDFFKEVGIPGEIYEDDWVDFSHNRNRALEYAFGKSKYLLVFDADDEICGDFVLPELTRDSYSLQFGSYTRPQIVNNHKRWKYVGVLHEYICSADSRIDDANTEIIKGPYHVISGRSGNRNLDSDKYLKDAIILENAYNDAVNAKDNMHIRYGFYCANSYYDCGKYESAISWYKKTLENGGWAQEKYVSCLKLYNCYNNLDNKEAGFFYLVKSAEYDRERAECYYELIKYYSGSGLHNVAYGYYGVLRDFYRDTYLNDDLNNKLFVDMSISEFHLPYYVVIVCEKMRDYQTGIHMYRILFTKKCKIFDKWLVGNMLYNLQFFTENVKEEDKSAFYLLFQEYVDFLVANNYPISDDKHEFMKTYEKYGIVVPSRHFECVSKEDCSRSKKILFYSGFSPFSWNYTYSTQHALGGSETALANLSKLFPPDFEIYVAGNVLEEKIVNNDNSHSNVTYVNIQNISNLVKTNAFHTVIVSRYVGFYDMYPETSYYQSFIWGHDIVLLSSGSNMDVESILSKWSDKITGCVCQTEWHKKLFVMNYPMLKDKIFVINNGIIVDRFINKPVKIPNRFIYTSCSERGLERLLKLWPKIIEKMPDAELYISSYNQFPSNEFEFRLRDVIEKHEGVKHLGSLNKTQLYEMMASAEYWLYPTSFSETSCITAMEMLMSEVICIYYPLAGLNNTLGKYGIQVIPGTEIQSIMNLSEERKTEMRINGKEYAMSCSWENRAKEWAGVLGLGLNSQYKDKQENKVTNMMKNMSNDKNTDTDICIKYGKQYNNVDVTEYVLKNLTTDGKIYIPKDDNYRASIFGDPLYSVKKCIFITDKLGKILKEFDYNTEVNYSLKREFNTSCIKVINLERRPDRKADITNQFQKHGINDYTIVEAVDGSQLEETQELANLFQGNNFNNNKGVIGCALSHLKLWYELINDVNNDYYVILEDDIELYDDFKNKLKEHCILFQQYGAEHLSLALSWGNSEEEQRKISTENVTIFRKNVYKFWNIGFAYIISKQAAQKIIDFVNICSIKCAIDNPRAYGDILVHHHTTQCILEHKKINIFGSDTNSSNCFSFSNNSNYNNQEIKVAFCDFWGEEYDGNCFDKKSNFITNIFDKANKKYTVVEPSQNPDIIIFSAMGNENEHTRHQNIRRVYYCGEPFVPREDVDYNITFDHTRPKNFRYPLWAAYMNSYLFEECERRKNGITTVPKRNKFCSFICNGECKTTWRKEIVEKLSQYKRVDCGGRFLNNIGYTVPRGTSCSGKIEHNLNYKFAIAFENEDHPGYVTEKICDVYKSNCIPIYSGNREVVEDFNPNTFINSNDFKNLDELVEYVIKVDNDDELYASYFKEPMFSNKWLDIFNDPHNTFYKNITDCIVGRHNNLYSNIMNSNNNKSLIKNLEKIVIYSHGWVYNLLKDYIENNNNNKNTKLQIYNIWHNKLFDNCYDKLDDYSLEKITMYDVNPTYTKVYNNDKKYNILKEYELTNYESLYQDTNYCQTSCFCHVYTNKLYEKSDYVGFIQYDMVLYADFIYDIEEKINKSNNDIYFYSLVDNNKLEVKYVCKPYENSILQKYNEYFNTNHSYETIKNNKKSSNFISLHTFVIPTKTYIKLMTWYMSIKDWLHSNYLNKLYDTSIAEITEEIFGLFLLLQMIEDESIELEELKLYHEWPKLHNETEWLNYKVAMPENVNKISNQSNNKTQKLIFDIGANIGNWALANISQENKIISVEASTSTFNKLVNNVSLYGNIVPLNYAVCDSKDEYITFYEAESDVLSSLNKEWIYGPESRFNCNYKTILSKTITLDKLIEQYGIPELIKIDVESAEYSCIKSLTKKVNNLCFEWASENQDMILNSLNYLFKLGFREFYIQMNNDDYKFVPNNYYSLNDTKQILLSTIYKRDWGMIHCR